MRSKQINIKLTEAQHKAISNMAMRMDWSLAEAARNLIMVGYTRFRKDDSDKFLTNVVREVDYIHNVLYPLTGERK